MYMDTHQKEVSSHHVLSCYISIYHVYILYMLDIYLYIELIQHVSIVFRFSWHSSATSTAHSWLRGQRARRSWWSWFWYPRYTSSVGKIHDPYPSWRMLSTRHYVKRPTGPEHAWYISQTIRTCSFAFCAITAAVAYCSRGSTNSCWRTWGWAGWG